jgi:fumarate reductase subunit C
VHRALSEAAFADGVDRRTQAHDGARGAQGRAVSARGETRLWLAQRASAAVLALCVVVHLATMIVAVNGGLTAADILGRTRGNPAWAAFYAVFVAAVAIHAPIGLRTIGAEWLRWRGRSADLCWLAVGAALFVTGIRAVAAVAL